jgi:hypothetical protein
VIQQKNAAQAEIDMAKIKWLQHTEYDPAAYEEGSPERNPNDPLFKGYVNDNEEDGFIVDPERKRSEKFHLSCETVSLDWVVDEPDQKNPAKKINMGGIQNLETWIKNNVFEWHDDLTDVLLYKLASRLTLDEEKQMQVQQQQQRERLMVEQDLLQNASVICSDRVSAAVPKEYDFCIMGDDSEETTKLILEIQEQLKKSCPALSVALNSATKFPLEKYETKGKGKDKNSVKVKAKDSIVKRKDQIKSSYNLILVVTSEETLKNKDVQLEINLALESELNVSVVHTTNNKLTAHRERIIGDFLKAEQDKVNEEAKDALHALIEKAHKDKDNKKEEALKSQLKNFQNKALSKDILFIASSLGARSIRYVPAVEKCETGVCYDPMCYTIRGFTSAGIVKTDDVKTPRTRGAGICQYRVGGLKKFVAEIEFSTDIYKDKRDKTKAVSKEPSADLKKMFEELFKLAGGSSDPENPKGVPWSEFQKFDLLCTESLGGHYSEMISRRVYSMMLYPGMTLDTDISWTTFFNYHWHVACKLKETHDDKNMNIIYKYIFDRVRQMKKGKRFQVNEDIIIVHDRSKHSLKLCKELTQVMRAHIPNVRVDTCTTTDSKGKDKETEEETAERLRLAKIAKDAQMGSCLNLLILLTPGVFDHKTVQAEILASQCLEDSEHEHKAQIMIMGLLDQECPLVIQEKAKCSDPNITQLLSRAAFCQYSSADSAACMLNLLKYCSFPDWAPAAKFLAPGSHNDVNSAVKYLYEKCEEDKDCANALACVANMTSPDALNGRDNQMSFLKGGGSLILIERFANNITTKPVCENACRVAANLALALPRADLNVQVDWQRMLQLVLDCLEDHQDSPALQGEAVRAINNFGHGSAETKRAVQEVQGFQKALTAQKANADELAFWLGRFETHQLATGDRAVVRSEGRDMCATIEMVYSNGTYDLLMGYGGKISRVPASTVRPMDDSDRMYQFCTGYLWKPDGQQVTDTIYLQADGISKMNSGGVGTWNNLPAKEGQREQIQIQTSEEMLKFERISKSTLRGLNSKHVIVMLEQELANLKAMYFAFPEGLSSQPMILGRKPTYTRSEQVVNKDAHDDTRTCWRGLDDLKNEEGEPLYSRSFVVKWVGYLEVRKQGRYEFSLGGPLSNTSLEIDENEVNDLIVGQETGQDVSIFLSPGTHRFIAQHWVPKEYDSQQHDHSKVEIKYSGPDTNKALTAIPAGCHSHNPFFANQRRKPGFLAEYMAPGTDVENALDEDGNFKGDFEVFNGRKMAKALRDIVRIEGALDFTDADQYEEDCEQYEKDEKIYQIDQTFKHLCDSEESVMGGPNGSWCFKDDAELKRYNQHCIDFEEYCESVWALEDYEMRKKQDKLKKDEKEPTLLKSLKPAAQSGDELSPIADKFWQLFSSQQEDAWNAGPEEADSKADKKTSRFEEFVFFRNLENPFFTRPLEPFRGLLKAHYEEPFYARYTAYLTIEQVDEKGKPYIFQLKSKSQHVQLKIDGHKIDFVNGEAEHHFPKTEQPKQYLLVVQFYGQAEDGLELKYRGADTLTQTPEEKKAYEADLDDWKKSAEAIFDYYKEYFDGLPEGAESMSPDSQKDVPHHAFMLMEEKDDKVTKVGDFIKTYKSPTPEVGDFWNVSSKNFDDEFDMFYHELELHLIEKDGEWHDKNYGEGNSDFKLLLKPAEPLPDTVYISTGTSTCHYAAEGAFYQKPVDCQKPQDWTTYPEYENPSVWTGRSTYKNKDKDKPPFAMAAQLTMKCTACKWTKDDNLFVVGGEAKIMRTVKDDKGNTKEVSTNGGKLFVFDKNYVLQWDDVDLIAPVTSLAIFTRSDEEAEALKAKKSGKPPKPMSKREKRRQYMEMLRRRQAGLNEEDSSSSDDSEDGDDNDVSRDLLVGLKNGDFLLFDMETGEQKFGEGVAMTWDEGTQKEIPVPVDKIKKFSDRLDPADKEEREFIERTEYGRSITEYRIGPKIRDNFSTACNDICFDAKGRIFCTVHQDGSIFFRWCTPGKVGEIAHPQCMEDFVLNADGNLVEVEDDEDADGDKSSENSWKAWHRQPKTPYLEFKVEDEKGRKVAVLSVHCNTGEYGQGQMWVVACDDGCLRFMQLRKAKVGKGKGRSFSEQREFRAGYNGPDHKQDYADGPAWKNRPYFDWIRSPGSTTLIDPDPYDANEVQEIMQRMLDAHEDPADDYDFIQADCPPDVMQAFRDNQETLEKGEKIEEIDNPLGCAFEDEFEASLGRKINWQDILSNDDDDEETAKKKASKAWPEAFLKPLERFWVKREWRGPPVVVKAHSAAITCARFDSTGKLLATCAGDATIKIWNTEALLNWRNDVFKETDMAKMKSDSQVAHFQVDTNKADKVLSFDANKMLTEVIDPIQCLSTFVSWSHDGCTLAASYEGSNVALYSAFTGTARQRQLKLFEAEITEVAWKHSNTELVACSKDETIKSLHNLKARDMMAMSKLEKEQKAFNQDFVSWQISLDEIRNEMKDYSSWRDYKKRIYDLYEAVQKGKKQSVDFNKREVLLGLPISDYYELDGLIDDYMPFYTTWDFVIRFNELQKTWHELPLTGGIGPDGKQIESVDGALVEELLETWNKGCVTMMKDYKGSAKMKTVYNVCRSLRDDMEEFKQPKKAKGSKLVFLMAFSNPAILSRHWKQLFEKMGAVWVKPKPELGQEPDKEESPEEHKAWVEEKATLSERTKDWTKEKHDFETNEHKLKLVEVLMGKGEKDPHKEGNEHWRYISMQEMLDVFGNGDLEFDFGVLDFAEDYEAIGAAAIKQKTLSRQMYEMMRFWKGEPPEGKELGPIKFVFGKKNGVPNLGGLDDIQAYLDDYIVKTQTIRSSPFCKPFEAEIQRWEHTLLYIQDFVDETVTLQRSWMSLEPIFKSDDIKRQLPQESKMFSEVDAIFRERMEDATIDHKTKKGNTECIRIATAIGLDSEKKMYPPSAESDISGIKPGIVGDLMYSNAQMEKVQKGLRDYLETKRCAFPRFFFLNDADLLQILAETKDPTAVQPHMGKVFEGIVEVKFHDKDGQPTFVGGMKSGEGEFIGFTQWDYKKGCECKQNDVKPYPSGSKKVSYVDSSGNFTGPVKGDDLMIVVGEHVNVQSEENFGAVEKWLLELEELMYDTLRVKAKISNDDYLDNVLQTVENRPQWAVEHAAQIVILTDCIYYTLEVEEALANHAIEGYEKKLRKQLGDFTQMVQKDMVKLHRVQVGAMVTIDVHSRDVVADLVKDDIKDPADFAWLSQLRYYWKDDKEFYQNTVGKTYSSKCEKGAGDNAKLECHTCIVNSTLLYGFEYLGASMRLVITPLTDRCYRTLMGAFALYYGGAPEGPAGTGKTESTKDLAKALAIQCVVFNCSDSMDYLQLAKFFKGLASSGSWCCFDEFNRISLEVLSVVAQQIQQISLAIKQGVKSFVFEDTHIGLVTTCAVNITMNPGYAGRSELPDNLKALFRPCAMMVPSYSLIAEIRLISFGYVEAKTIGMKATMALKLSSEQLSPQRHYDFGMRGLNALLVAAGIGRQTFSTRLALPADHKDHVVEKQVGLVSFIDVNMPKFTSADKPLFENIMTDLFPGVLLVAPDYGLFRKHLKQQTEKKGLQPTESFLGKVIQLWETVLVRHGLMTVGMPPCGKSCVKDVLAATIAQQEIKDSGPDKFYDVVQYVMNPKSITQGQLYGENNSDGSWIDGVLAIAVRNGSKPLIAEEFGGDNIKRRQWVVLDGPVDAIWIENMNTVLDDNKKLCLNSGEIIKLSDVTTMLFEVRDLDYASPATVSRVGIVFMEPDTTLGWRPIVDSWCDTLDAKIKEKKVLPRDPKTAKILLGEDPEFRETRWARHADKIKQQIRHLFYGHLDLILEAVRTCKCPFAVSNNWLALSATRMFEGILDSYAFDYEPGKLGDITEAHNEALIWQLFFFTMIWTCGVVSDESGRNKMDDVFRSMYEHKKITDLAKDTQLNLKDGLIAKLVEKSIEAGIEKFGAESFGETIQFTEKPKLNPDGTPVLEADGKTEAMEKIFEFTLKGFRPYVCSDADLDKNGLPALPKGKEVNLANYYPHNEGDENWVWCEWTKKITDDMKKIPPSYEFHQIVVPTQDTVRNQYMIKILIENQYNILFCGSTGTAKTASIQGMLLKGFEKELYSSMSFAFSAQTTCNQTQDIVDGKLAKRKKGVFGPPIGKRMLIFVDDVNMPIKEEYGAQPPIEILRQAFTTYHYTGEPGNAPPGLSGRGWYDRTPGSTQWDFRNLIDINWLAAMCPPGSGKNDITDRYSSHFNMIFVLPFESSSLNLIFSTSVGKFFANLPNEPKAETENIVKATLDVYMQMDEKFKPTPAKSHYTFNMRDVAKVFQGLCQCTRESVPKKDDLCRVWLHESSRVFCDRLVDSTDQKKFMAMMKTLMNKYLQRPFEQVVEDPSVPILFTSFVDPKSKAYLECTDLDKLKQKVNDYMADFNETSKGVSLDLVLFLAFLEHICRVVRVLNLPLGNALLIGVGGSGRKSVTTLATHVAEFELFQISIGKGYGMKEWHEDMIKLLVRAGASNQNVVFLFPDTSIANEAFLEEVSSILNTGEIPNLFDADSMNDIMDKCTKPATAAKGGEVTPPEIFSYFVEACRKNLSVSVAMSPIGSAFRERLRNFPALVNCCTCDWFMDWPEQALNSVAHQKLEAIDMEQKVKNGVVNVMVIAQTSVTALAKKFFEMEKRVYYVTPTSYLELISTFIQVLKQQRQMVSQGKTRYDNGIEKIEDASAAVATLQKELEDMAPFLEKTVKETGILMTEVAALVEAAEEQASGVDVEVQEGAKVAAAAQEVKDRVKVELQAADPALKAAEDALGSLTKGDIGEVKGFKTPSAGVLLVAEMLCYFFGVSPKKGDFWEPCKKNVLSDPRLLENMINYDKDNITKAIITKAQPIYDNEAFDPEVVKKSSLAAMGICKWARAMVEYYHVFQKVGPLRIELASAIEKQDAAEAKVAKLNAELDEVKANVAYQESVLKEAKDKKEDLENTQKKCQSKLVAAEKLIGGLGGEKANWLALSSKLARDYVNLTGDMLLVGGVMAYLGCFTTAYRAEALEKWRTELLKMKIPASKEFDLRTIIGDEVKIRNWNLDLLPNDRLSIDNAIIYDTSNRWPLFIDPQGQANTWIKKMFNERKELGTSATYKNLVVSDDPNMANIYIMRLTDNYTTKLTTAIRNCTAFMFEDIGTTLDAMLDPILLKQVFKQGPDLMIKVGDEVLPTEDWANWQFFLTTKLSNPHYAPEICVATCLLNFMATADGLADQMLGVLIQEEEPEIEKTRQALIKSSAASKEELKAIEDKILALLAASQGDILEDVVLIHTLDESKEKTAKIAEAVKVQEQDAALIATTREKYEGLGRDCAVFFFIVADLVSIDPMYQYSLDWFKQQFIESLKLGQGKSKGAKLDAEGEPLEELRDEERLQEILKFHQRHLWRMVLRSLFSKDKLLFSLMLAWKSQEITKDEEKKINLPQIDALIKGLPIGKTEPLPEEAQTNPDLKWLEDASWKKLQALDKLKGKFENIHNNLITNAAEWKDVFNAEDPMAKSCPWPGGLKEALKPIERAMVMAAIRPDKTIQGCQEIILDVLGVEFLRIPPFDLPGAFSESDAMSTILFIIAMGSDPMADITRLAEATQKSDKSGNMLSMIVPVSLGQGQGPKAHAAIWKGFKTGAWVLLQNCHLGISYMPSLEATLKEIPGLTGYNGKGGPKGPHVDFRLMLTACPSPEFPIAIIQNSIKMTVEPPKGIKNAVVRAYSSMDPDWFESSSQHMKPIFKKMLWGLVFFHGLILERRDFGAIGWNTRYGFSEPDFDISSKEMLNFLEDFSPDADKIKMGPSGKWDCEAVTDEKALKDYVPWAALQYMGSECNYGGRVTDMQDRRDIAVMIRDYYTPKILDDSYKFSPSGEFFVPKCDTLEEFLKYAVEELPMNTRPEVYWMHGNADLTKAVQEAQYTSKSAILMMGSFGAGGNAAAEDEDDDQDQDVKVKTPEEQYQELAQGCYDKLMSLSWDESDAKKGPLFDMNPVMIKYATDKKQCMNTVLLMELGKVNRLMKKLLDTTSNVVKAVKGEVVFSPELEQVAFGLLLNSLPAPWLSVSYPSLKPALSYFEDFIVRFKFFRAWVGIDKFEADGTTLKRTHPNSYWFSAFFFQQALLTGAMQNFSRYEGTADNPEKPKAIDLCIWNFDMVKNVNGSQNKFGDENGQPYTNFAPGHPQFDDSNYGTKVSDTKKTCSVASPVKDMETLEVKFDRDAPTQVDINTPPEKGLYAWGFFMDGARWDDDNCTIDDCTPKVMWSNMCTVWFKPAMMDENDPQEKVVSGAEATDQLNCPKETFPNPRYLSEKFSAPPKPWTSKGGLMAQGLVYDCPVYKNSDRKGVLSTSGHSSNFILWLCIPIKSKTEQYGGEEKLQLLVGEAAAWTRELWTKAGVALCTQKDE